MAHNSFNAPGHPNWYHCDGKCEDPPRGARYEFPLPVVPNAPVPSKADYSPKNVAALIEFLAGLIGQPHTGIALRYENNTPENPDDDIIVEHPNDRLYLPTENVCAFEKSPELIRYEMFAKKSKLLKLYEEHSPAQIMFFQDICDGNSSSGGDGDIPNPPPIQDIHVIANGGMANGGTSRVTATYTIVSVGGLKAKGKAIEGGMDAGPMTDAFGLGGMEISGSAIVESITMTDGIYGPEYSEEYH